MELTVTEGLPEIIAESCVHTRISDARCRACVAACPRQAWTIDDAQLGIDIHACDGCGLCVPACPEGAISHGRPLIAKIRSWRGQPALFRACEKTGLAMDDERMACLHTIGAREIFSLYRRGVAAWVVTAADCDACPRGTVQRLTETVRQANQLLQNRNLPSIVLTALDPRQWREAFVQSSPERDPDQPAMTRRNFFRGALRVALRTAADVAAIPEAGPTFAPLAAWLPSVGPEDLFPHAPHIDPLRCNGCDACARLCPHRAIRLETLENTLRYRIDAQQCTGCDICQDVCDQNALRIETLQPQTQTEVALTQARCPACAASYHLPTEQRRADPLCPVCARTRHGQQLYQVLK